MINDVISRYEARLADKQASLDRVHRLLGAKDFLIEDLRRRLAEAEAAIVELQAMNERAREAA